MKSEHQKRVEEFMRLAGQEVPSGPIIPSLEIRKFRADMILEEALETIEGLGFEVNQVGPDGELELKEMFHPDLPLIVDGCADIKVVTTGTLSACGVQDEPIQLEVDRNNLLKFGSGAYRRSDGKWMKPPDHRPPEILKLLKDQGLA